MYLYPVCVVVKEQHSRACDLLCLHHGLQVCQQAHMLRHVSGQYLHTHTHTHKDNAKFSNTPSNSKLLTQDTNEPTEWGGSAAGCSPCQ